MPKDTEEEKAKKVQRKNQKILSAKNLEIWKTTIQTQMHFNEMLQKVRFLGLTVFIAAMAAAAETLRVQPSIRVEPLCNLHIAAVIQFFALLLWGSLVCLEIYFFGLLLGAVDYAEQLEKTYDMPELGLTGQITLRVSKKLAIILVAIFYTLPAIGGGAFFWILLSL